MPKIRDRLVHQLQAKGKSKKAAYAIATAALNRAGDTKGNKATAKGTKRGNMTPAARAKDRQAKYSGGKPSDYKYNKKTNIATKSR
jgi:hypothetical protein